MPTLALWLALLAQVTSGSTVARDAPPPPDYGDPANWAARPDRPGPAQSVPTNATPLARRPAVDVFYIHPTTFRSAEQWNQRIDDAATNSWTDRSVIARQASVFNGCCRVFAPRYRQASTRAFAEMAGEGAKAYDLAYGDVVRAFDSFLASAHGRPFILAGHSQGALFVTRLLADRISRTPLAARMVAAYAIGVPVKRGAGGVPPCDRPKQTGCVISWNSFLAGSDTSAYFARTLGVVSTADAASTLVCTNLAAKNAATALPGAAIPVGLQPLRRQSVRATCVGGVLAVQPDPALELTPLPGGNMHFHDIALFYGELRADAIRRSAAYRKAHP
ncbi:DUF3089 domain-containing protein [uncultured Sphingomonas sp.]|uniref:DUF3089 domain-containing protein n=1 Tax=uncultured Sphingomonas sp. TaxID=158754 RepID=UPI0035CC39F0